MIPRCLVSAAVGLVLAAVGASPAAAAAPAWSPVAASGPTNLSPVQSETQRIGVDAEGGTFTLTFDSKTTAAIPFDAESSTVESALNALPSIAGVGGSASVGGGPGGPDAEHPYFVTFDGSLANSDVAQLTADASSLTGSGHSASVITTVPGGPGTGQIAIYAQNVGGLSTSGTIAIEVTLPTGVTTSATPEGPPFPVAWNCSPGAGQQSFTCTSTAAVIVPPGSVSPAINAPVVTDPSASGTKPVEITVSGGGAPDASYSMPLTVSSAPADPGIQAFTAGAYDANGVLDTRAGGHPYSGSTAIFANTYRNHFGKVVPVGEFKDIEVDLPPGFLGNPIATPQCPENELSADPVGCKAETIVGQAAPIVGSFGNFDAKAPVYNVEAPFGYPGKFFFRVAGTPIHAVGSLRSDGDYGLTVGSLNTAQLATVYGSFFTFWGAPADPTHDNQRCVIPFGGVVPLCDPPVPSTADNTAFLTNPTDCAREALEPPVVNLRVTLWQSPLVTRTGSVDVPPVTECDKLKLETDFTFEPSDTKSDSPAAFKTSLTVPSEGLTDPDKLTTPEIKDTVVRLPKGVVLNASGADGLEACSLQQIGFKGKNFPMPNPMRFDKEPNQCPEASKIGGGELKTALLADPLHGGLYLAAQGAGNPFGSLFAIYLVIEDPRHGIFIKLAGRVDPDPQDGRMTVSFENLPQLPFTRLDLNLKGGNRSALASPTTCGKYLTTATNTPWSAPESGPPTISANSFEINQGPNGLPCANTPAQRPFGIGLSAGSRDPIAGARSPFSFRITRPDGHQEIGRLSIAPPPGFVASLRGIPYCSESQLAAAAARTGRAEQRSPSCPAASQVGTTDAGAGSGPTPFYAPGKLYLAGPYKGAKLSVVAITPAVAGPFDLGTVVIRSALLVDPTTARITAVSDPVPQIVRGVPLRVRDIRVNLDRPGFTRNPTNCSEMAVNVTVFGSNGAVSNPASRFQVGGCRKLGFKPKLKLKLKGGTGRGAHPSLRAVLLPREGDANFARAAVTLPHSAFLDQAHIRTICTRVQFAANACPTGAIYGHARAFTPLLDNPLEGPVYLRSSDNKLPDLVAKLGGQVDIELVGRIDSVNGGIRNTFAVIPDAPVSKFVLTMQGGKKGLVVNSTNLCRKANRAKVKLKAQNNRRHDFRPKVVPTKCAKHRKHKRRPH